MAPLKTAAGDAKARGAGGGAFRAACCGGARTRPLRRRPRLARRPSPPVQPCGGRWCFRRPSIGRAAAGVLVCPLRLPPLTPRPRGLLSFPPLQAQLKLTLAPSARVPSPPSTARRPALVGVVHYSWLQLKARSRLCIWLFRVSEPCWRPRKRVPPPAACRHRTAPAAPPRPCAPETLRRLLAVCLRWVLPLVAWARRIAGDNDARHVALLPPSFAGWLVRSRREPRVARHPTTADNTAPATHRVPPSLRQIERRRVGP